MIVEQSNFEQFSPSQFIMLKRKILFFVFCKEVKPKSILPFRGCASSLVGLPV
jgi:hypothetical protein